MKIFNLPDLGEGLAEAEIREWYVKVGDTVAVDQPLVSMETAKAVVDVPSPYAGKITELHGKANEVIKTGAALVTFFTGETIKDKGSVVGKLESSEKKWDDNEVIVGTGAVKPASTIKIMPAARVLANELNVDLTKVKATGPNGLITIADVKRMLSKQILPSSLGEQAEALHGVRRFMAQAMMQSHQEVVPATIFEDADISSLNQVTDLTVKIMLAIVAAVKLEPSLNAWFDGSTLTRRAFKEVNIGMAVDTAEGLFVPVIKNVERATESDLRQQLNKYKESASARTIAPADMQGATITFSNFGTMAGRYATPIIIPPAVAILACGRTREVALPKAGKLTIGRCLPLSLTFDHRAVTGGEAARFLAAVIKHIECSDS